MTDRLAPMSRRSFLLASSGAIGTAGCELGNPLAPRQENVRTIDEESLIGGDQINCAPVAGTPTDIGWALRMMRVPEAWAYSRKRNRPAHGDNVVIGHVDTGVADHVELRPSKLGEKSPILWERGYDFVDDERGGYDPLVNTWHLEQIGHGTGTASVIVSRGGVVSRAGVMDWPDFDPTCSSTTGPGRITGAAPAAFLLPVRAFRFAATGERRRVAQAIDYLVDEDVKSPDEKVQVITMALGWPDESATLEKAIVKAVRNNIIVLAAAGNWVERITFPARAQTAIGIAGVGPDGKPWRYSSHGREVVASAPADKVWRAYRDHKTNRVDLISPRFGTSYAVSLTAGVAALWIAHYGRPTLIEIAQTKGWTLQDLFREALSQSASAPEDWKRDYGAQFGAGIVNAEKLLQFDECRLERLTKTLQPSPAPRLPADRSCQ